MIIEKGTLKDADELENLYNDLNDYSSTHINYPGWIKDIYPVRQTAIDGIQKGSLFVLRINNTIAGSIILNHHPEDAYYQVEWGISADYEDIIVIHTLVVHPCFMKKGVGEALLTYAKKYCFNNRIKSIRLDVSVDNLPAIRLYEKMGYQYVTTVDLGLSYEHLKWFKLYELIL
jgi:ribosomal protein S18 acetylase RimI-like enzyme